MAQGIPYDQYAKMTGMDEKKFMEEGREPAIRQVKMDLAISQIIEQEKLEVSDEEVEKEYERLSGFYGMEVDMVKKYLDPNAVRTQVLNDKAVAVVVDNAKPAKASAKKTEAKEETPADEQAEKKPAARKTAKKAEDKAETAEEKPAKKPAAKKTAAKKAGDAEEKPAKKPAAKKTAKKAE